MNELNDIPENTHKPMSLAGLGHILSEAREAAGITQEEAAAQLKLSARQVASMEAGNLDALPGPAFVRGFVRNYARLLHIDAEPLLAAYQAHLPAAGGSHISLHSENIQIAGRNKKGWRPYLLVAVLLALLLAAWAVYMAEPRVVAPAAESPQTAPAAAPAPAAPMTELQPLPTLEQAPDAPAPAAAPATPAAPAVVAAPGQASVTLVSGIAGWVSIRDGNEQVIYQKLMPAGSTETVQGQPPLHMVIGNVTATRVSYNGAPVDLAPHTKGNVARFTLD